MSDIETLQAAIQFHWPGPPGEKAVHYIGRFFDGTRTGTKIVGKVIGNHGTYTVSIDARRDGVPAACSCYIGKGGYCHHCAALGHTFLRLIEPSQVRADSSDFVYQVYLRYDSVNQPIGRMTERSTS